MRKFSKKKLALMCLLLCQLGGRNSSCNAVNAQSPQTLAAVGGGERFLWDFIF